jgi:hypothetical protein
MLADSAKTLFEIANDNYNKGEYEQSIALYDSLLSNSVESAELYYNLGNAWYKLDEIPKAILYYEKAKKIEPNNADIIYNLNLANTKIADRIEVVPVFFLKTWWFNMLNTFNEKQWTIINISMFLVFLVFIIILLTTKKPSLKKLSFSFAIIFIILSFVSGLIGYRSYQIKTKHSTAIIFTPTVNIKSAPDDKSSTIFILHQGTKVKLLDETPNWQKVKIGNGSEGWLLKDDFEVI